MLLRVSILIVIFISIINLDVYSQACPACSNPALQSSEKLEAGLDTLQKGTLRFTLNVTNGFNYQGGHPNYKGLTPNGNVIAVPLHNHIVSLDFLRTEINAEYTFARNWSVWLRIPYDIKIQEASVEYPVPVTTEEREAILRNRDIHHRNETYTGVSDLRLLVARRINGFLSTDGRLDIAVGTSLPTGQTEEDPLTAIAAGKKHLHIQFGTGAFDPLLELHWSRFLSEKISLAVYTINKFPFYENRKGYKGPVETTTGLSAGYNITNQISGRATIANFSQGYAKWNEIRDPNSGLVSWNGNLSMTFRFKNGLLLTPGYRFPISQRTLNGEGDTFKYGSTFLLNVSSLIIR